MFQEIFDILNVLKTKDVITSLDIVEIELKLIELETRCVVWSVEDVRDFLTEYGFDDIVLSDSQINNILDMVFKNNTYISLNEIRNELVSFLKEKNIYVKYIPSLLELEL